MYKNLYTSDYFNIIFVIITIIIIAGVVFVVIVTIIIVVSCGKLLDQLNYFHSPAFFPRFALNAPSKYLQKLKEKTRL